ncbi:ATP-binding protein [Nocardioides sp.]|uniref:ATP-binding protein n=1 Tax=Nocardioides sp. TaxID=35761 RepID=UPI002BE0B760|nr:ATP-binding protein [Nocardioides sp.]HXH80529.1 ATP-binding protein [Nocardioides sp.]
MSNGVTPPVVHDALQLIAESVVDLVGFGVAAIRVLREEDSVLETVAVAGDDDARSQLLGSRIAVRSTLDDIERADRWGMLRFVPSERFVAGDGEPVWIPEIEVAPGPDAWHPMDLLMAPIYDSGELLGVLYMDVPDNGRRPDQATRELLNKYAAQAGRAVLTEVARRRLEEQVRLATAARQIVRAVGSELSVERIMEVCQPAIAQGLHVSGLWIQTFDEDGEGRSAIYTGTDSEVIMPADLVQISRDAAGLLWQAQETVVVAVDRKPPPIITAAQQTLISEFLTTLEVSSILFVPLGAGQECLGNLVLTRRGPGVEWTAIETSTALDIAQDLGRALLNARNFEREQQLVSELRELDTYRSRLIATVAHELKNPLTSILGHVEMLDAASGVPSRAQRSVAFIERGAVRMERVIEDMLTLAEVGDPNNALVAIPVDMRPLVADALDLVSLTIGRKRLAAIHEPASQPVVALGDVSDLDRVCGNLISNAVKYTPEGRSITVTLEQRAVDVVLVVADEGLGISTKDQERLFEEFFRSTNPEAVAEPGTGLGLTIVHRIIARHGGRIEVASQLGKGTTFTVFIPAASSAT